MEACDLLMTGGCALSAVMQEAQRRTGELVLRAGLGKLPEPGP